MPEQELRCKISARACSLQRRPTCAKLAPRTPPTLMPACSCRLQRLLRKVRLNVNMTASCTSWAAILTSAGMLCIGLSTRTVCPQVTEATSKRRALTCIASLDAHTAKAAAHGQMQKFLQDVQLHCLLLQQHWWYCRALTADLLPKVVPFWPEAQHDMWPALREPCSNSAKVRNLTAVLHPLQQLPLSLQICTGCCLWPESAPA